TAYTTLAMRASIEAGKPQDAQDLLQLASQHSSQRALNASQLIELADVLFDYPKTPITDTSKIVSLYNDVGCMLLIPPLGDALDLALLLRRLREISPSDADVLQLLWEEARQEEASERT